jgi:hypothetical protein
MVCICVAVSSTLRQLRFESIEQDPLVGGVLIDHIESVWPFGYDERAIRLAEHAQCGRVGHERRRLRAITFSRQVPRCLLCGGIRPAVARQGAKLTGFHTHLKKRIRNGSVKHAVNLALVCEAHLALCWMNVDIDVGWWNGQVDGSQRVSTHHEKAGICFLKGECKTPVCDRSPVDEYVNGRSVLATELGATCQPIHVNAPATSSKDDH